MLQPVQTLGAALVVAWLLPFHVEPVPSFYSEWVVGAGLALACCLAARASLDQPARPGLDAPLQLSLPFSSLWLLPLGLVGLLQFASGRLIHPETLAHFGAYLLAWAATLFLVSRRADDEGQAASLLPLAWACVIGSTLSCLVQIVQWAGWDQALEPWVYPMDLHRGRPYGNIAQPNLVATLHGLGLASALWLWHQGRVRTVLALPAVLAALGGLALSGSRTGLLFIPLLALIGWFLPVGPQASRRTVRLVLVLGLPTLLALSMALLRLGSGDASAPLARVGNFQSSERLVLWQIAREAFAMRPLLGHGLGAFSEAYFMAVTQVEGALGLAHHAHNLVLELLVEVGVLGVGAMLVILVLHWRRARARWSFDANSAFGLAMLGILLLHSMLEFPLWYLHFFVVFAWVCGALDPVRLSVTLPGLPRKTILAVLALLLVLTVKFPLDFWQASNRLYAFLESPERARAEAQDHPAANVFASLHAWIRHAYTPLRPPLDAAELQERGAATMRRPFPQVLLKLIVAEDLAGHPQERARLEQLYRRLYPEFDGLANTYLRTACEQFTRPGLCDLAAQFKPEAQRAP